MIKIKKDKSIQIELLSLALSCLIFITLFIFFLCEDYRLKIIGIYSVAIASEIIFVLLLYILLRLCNKSEFVIDSTGISLYRNGIEIAKLEAEFIGDINYIRFINTFTLQFGAGYLFVEYNSYKIIRPMLEMSNGKIFYGIAMSKKQAKAIAEILGKPIKIS